MTELEQLEAQQRTMSERAELATITVEVVATPAEASGDGPADEEGIGDGLRSGWDALVAVVLAIVYVMLAVLLPFLVVMLVIAGLACWCCAASRHGEEAGEGWRRGCRTTRSARTGPRARHPRG